MLGSRAKGASLALAGAAPPQLLAGEHVYSGGAPGLALALAPVHAVLRRVLPDEGPLRGPGSDRARPLVWLLTVLGAAVPLAVGAVAIRRACASLGASEPHALAAALTHALATTALPFATRLYAHSLVVALVASGLALLLSKNDGRKFFRAAGAGCLAAASFASDYSAGLPAAVLFLLALERTGLRGALAFALGALPPLAALGAYHAACFGSPLSLPYDHRIEASTKELLQTGAYGFTLPSPAVVLQLLAGPRRGFLLAQPATLLGLVGLVAGLRPSRGRALAPWALALLGAAGVFGANAARTRDWAAGFSFGPRYASAALPFLALGAPRGFALLGPAAPCLVGLSSLVALSGALTDWTYSLPGTFEIVWLGGVHASAALAAAGATAVAVLLLSPRSRGEWLGLALVPLALATPGALREAWTRRPATSGLAEVERRERRRAVTWALDAREARERAAVAAQAWRDPVLYYRALERVCELDPGDAETRAERDRVRVELDRALHAPPGEQPPR